MGSENFVSIIIPCYNARTTIAETIESVMAQTYNNWELLVIDDCSTDGSAEIIKQYSAKDARIRYLRTDALSGSPALPRNIGIDNARGRFIAFLDADDVWLPEKLEKQVAFMTAKNCPLSYSYYEKMNWQGHRRKRIVRTRDLTTYGSILKSNSIPCLTSMIRRDVVGTTRFKQIPPEDFCFWLDILKKGYTALNMCEVTALYREAPTSRSSNKLDMFRGYWNVIRNHQRIAFLPACRYMMTYAVLGFAKYLK